MYKRPIYHLLVKRLQEPRRFIQALLGPRQSGKTTLVQQVIRHLEMPAHYATADEPTLKDRIWIEQQWETARVKAKNKSAVLVLDEIQKIPYWSDTVKRLWDEDTHSLRPLQVVILGSAPWLIQQGLSDSLAGRFEVIPVTHWSFSEMREAFRLSLNEYIFYGGYPGSAPLIKEPHRWCQYIHNSLIETTLSRDILLMKRVDKPALLRRLFELGCLYSAQILSYNKMLGQMHDAGNATTLAHYLELLKGAGFLEGLTKYSKGVRHRASSPKLQVHNNALMAAQLNLDFKDVRSRPDLWGRMVESAIGASLLNGIKGTPIDLYYWANRNQEVDFVLKKDDRIVAIEVKSGQRKASVPGVKAFSNSFNVYRSLLVGAQGIPIEDFISFSPEEWFS
jgi:predicted AAA+ superfamily ATPase